MSLPRAKPRVQRAERAASADKLFGNFGSGLNLASVLKPSPQSLHGQADQSIRRSIRENRPTDAKREMKIKTGKRNWAS